MVLGIQQILQQQAVQAVVAQIILRLARLAILHPYHQRKATAVAQEARDKVRHEAAAVVVAQVVREVIVLGQLVRAVLAKSTI